MHPLFAVALRPRRTKNDFRIALLCRRESSSHPGLTCTGVLGLCASSRPLGRQGRCHSRLLGPDVEFESFLRELKAFVALEVLTVDIRSVLDAHALKACWVASSVSADGAFLRLLHESAPRVVAVLGHCGTLCHGSKWRPSRSVFSEQISYSSKCRDQGQTDFLTRAAWNSIVTFRFRVNEFLSGGRRCHVGTAGEAPLQMEF
jgi:hypothetical protein